MTRVGDVHIEEDQPACRKNGLCNVNGDSRRYNKSGKDGKSGKDRRARKRSGMSLKLLLYVIILLLLVVAGALITGQFDIHPVVGIAVAFVIVLVAAEVTRKKGE